MNDFLLIFRRDPATAQTEQSPAQLQAWMKEWMDWIGGIAAQNKLVSQGNRLDQDGNVVKAGGIVTNGPYVEVKEVIGGYTIIRAESKEEASEMAMGCPILKVGGSVEVRAIMAM
ncbi:MAG: YciI family protein [Mucilaginibacter sp.]|uniref:YciI family protein n=1 Tax=Mucilaginibacter sp. TaxID=1882438 RepID=UPI0031A154B2